MGAGMGADIQHDSSVSQQSFCGCVSHNGCTGELNNFWGSLISEFAIEKLSIGMADQEIMPQPWPSKANLCKPVIQYDICLCHFW